MDRLPYDVLQSICQLLPQSIAQLSILTNVSKRFQSAFDTQRSWYNAFKFTYPAWSSQVQFEQEGCSSSNWEKMAKGFLRQTEQLSTLHFKHLSIESQLHYFQPTSTSPLVGLSLRGDDGLESDTLLGSSYVQSLGDNMLVDGFDDFEIAGKTVVEVDHFTKTGFAGLAILRRGPETDGKENYESTILIWDYPSWRLIHSFKVDFLCQLASIQSIQIPTAEDGPSTKMTFFTLAVGVSTGKGEMLSQSILVYRLYENYETQCIAHIELGSLVPSPDIFLFSQASWRSPNNCNDQNISPERVPDWLYVLSPENAKFKPNRTLFATVFGRRGGSGRFISRLFHIDLTCTFRSNGGGASRSKGPKIVAFWRAKLPMGWKEGHHIRFPPQLSHLVIARKSQDKGLALFDWRFGVKVGTLPQTTLQKTLQFLSSPMETARQTNNEKEQRAGETLAEENFLGLDRVCREAYKIVTVMPISMSGNSSSYDIVSRLGLRLISFNSDRDGNQRIQSWDISYLMDINWYPLSRLKSTSLANKVETDQISNIEAHSDILDAMKQRYPWWERGPLYLKYIASSVLDRKYVLPYSNPTSAHPMILEHSFKKVNDGDSVSVIKFDTFASSIALLLNTGELLIIDIERGEPLRRLDLTTIDKNFAGIELSIINSKEIIITSEKTLLRGVIE